MSAPDLLGLVAGAIYGAHKKTPESFLLMAEAAIAAVHAHETCSRCGAAVAPPTLCDACAADKTPSVQTDRRGNGGT